MLPCNDDEGWSRVFKLSDFGIAPNEQFIIKSGQIGISNSTISTILYVTVSSVDGDYPDFITTPFRTKLLGTGSFGKTPIITGAPQIIQTQFDPIVVQLELKEY
jgi:hypothetical protein